MRLVAKGHFGEQVGIITPTGSKYAPYRATPDGKANKAKICLTEQDAKAHLRSVSGAVSFQKETNASY